MKKILSARVLVIALLVLNLGFTAAIFAGAVKLRALVSGPYAYYKEILANSTLKVGDSTTAATTIAFNGGTAASSPKVLAVKNNGYQTYEVGTAGGRLNVSGDFNVQDSSSPPKTLFFVQSSTNRVGIGTTTPNATLEVRPNTTFGTGTTPLDLGDIKGMILTAHAPGGVQDYTYPWAEMNAQYNFTDSMVPALNNGARAGFAAIGSDATNNTGAKYWVTTHIDGKPLCLQTIAKGLPAGNGYGQVVIRGYPTENGMGSQPPDPAWQIAPPSGGSTALLNAALVVGEWNNVNYGDLTNFPLPYGGYTPEARANNWNTFSSRAYKKDITPLSPADYGAVLARLDSTQIYHWRYKSDSPNFRPHTGYIAEEAPKDVVIDKGAISLGDNVGFLLASLKALELENQAIAKRVKELQS